MATLTITVGKSLAEGLQGFESMTQMGEIFSPKRWELVEVLKNTGPQTIYALAKRLDRHYRNVHQDVTKLSEWMVIEKDASGKVFVPWDKIDVQWPLEREAARVKEVSK